MFDYKPKYRWKILDKNVVGETFFKYGYVIYTVENISTHERKNMKTEDCSFVVGDIIGCIEPNSLRPGPELLHE